MKNTSERAVGFGLLIAVLAIGLFGTACKKQGDTAGDDPESATMQAVQYHCPMHPQVVADKPGSCPICKMDLVPMDADEMDEEDHSGHQHGQAPAPSSMEGQAAVRLPPGREQLIGVRTSVVETRPMVRKIQASAKVAYDTELYTAIKEYREALKAQTDIQDSQWPDVKERSRSLVDSSKLRLQIMGLSDAQIRQLASSSQDPTHLLIAEPGKNVWVYAQIYEQEAGMVKAGQTMRVFSSAFPGRSYTGRIISVDRVLNPETRSLRVRAEVPNPDGLLKPEMYLDAEIYADLGKSLAVPSEAVLHTGTRQLVFVLTGEGQYSPREVQTGNQAENYVAVVSGLKDGERVVTSANFLIDSESKLKAAIGQSSHQHEKK